jgi:hypothetical protein
MRKIEKNGSLGQGWPTPSSWEKGEEEEERHIYYIVYVQNV